MIKRLALTVVASLGLAYIADYLVFTGRRHFQGAVLGSVTVEHYYAVHEKNGKVEYIFQNPETEACARSLFPHAGYAPCWYLKRHKDKRVDI